MLTNQQKPYEFPLIDSLNPININFILATFFKVIGVDFPNPVTGTAFGQVGKNNILLNNDMIKTLQSANGYAPTVAARCFIAGTPILMADGSQKPIEEVDVGDLVMAFDGDAEGGLGASVPKRVTKRFTNSTRVLIDLWGLRVTPGHEFLADGGEFMKIADILRNDRCFVREVDGRGVPVRARTNLPLTSLGDALVRTRFKDPRTGAWRKASVRGAIPFERVMAPRGDALTARMASLVEVLHHDGRLCTQSFAASGQLRDPEGRPLDVVAWPEGQTPFDVEGAENHVVLLDDAPFTPDWVKALPRDGEEERAVVNAGGGRHDMLLLGPGDMITMTAADGQGRWNTPAPRQQLPSQRTALHVVGG